MNPPREPPAIRNQQPGSMRPSAGFTLVELLVVILVIGVLAGIAIFAVNAFRDDAAASSCSADRRILVGAITGYEAGTGSPPATLTDLITRGLIAGDPNVNATTKTGSGYTLTYDSAAGTLNGCADALAAGGTPVGGGGPAATSSPSPTITSTTSAPASPTPSPLSTPTITGLSPNPMAARNNLTQTLTVDGTGFVSGATISISPALTTTAASFVNATRLTVGVIAPNNKKGSFVVTVTNPDGGVSTGVSFTVN